MAAAVMSMTGMLPRLMLMIVVITARIRIISQRAHQQRFHSIIRIAGNTAIQFDAGRSQRHLSTAANTAANQDIHAIRAQKTCQGAMTASVCTHYLRLHNSTVDHFIYFELLRVPKMLKYRTVLIRYRNFHTDTLLSQIHHSTSSYRLG